MTRRAHARHGDDRGNRPARSGDGAETLRQRLVEKGVKYGLATYVDVHGVPKAKAVPIAHLGRMLRASEMFTGAALDGVPQAVNDDEVCARPDPDGVVVLPWNREIAWFPSDLQLHGAPFTACSRGILKRALARAAGMGFRFHLGVETEFHLFKDTPGGGFAVVSERDRLDKPAYDVRTLTDHYPIMDEIVSAMNALGWDVFSFDHEDSPGQFETDFAYADALVMADRFTFFRYMVHEIARRHGAFASFMPKPRVDRTGSGAHFNMSLADLRSGGNLFASSEDARGCGLSKLGYQFIAGVLRHAAAICAVAAPTVNSYKRLVLKGSMSGYTWAPVYVCYGGNNRTNMLRIPQEGGRVECRAPDIACNPYLAAAMFVSAGLEGIREGLDPGEPHMENMYEYTAADLQTRGIAVLPRTLLHATEALRADPLSREVLGDLMLDTFVELKTREWTEYHNHVSDWELARYLRMF
jgi:glutamine synthetase